jgi:Flp pilus assembly protein TadG
MFSPHRATRTEGEQRQRGLAAVEFAICVPLLLFLMVTTAEFGRALMQYNTLTKSVRDSVRHVAGEAALGTAGSILVDANLVTQGQNLVAYGTIGAGSELLPGLVPGNVTVATAGAEDVRVSVSYAYQPMYAVIPGFGVGANRSGLFTFNAASTMRAL